jgi:hemoglobin
VTRGLLALLLAGCATTPPQTSPPDPADRSLYARLGGEPAVGAVVDEFMARVAKDERINARFINSDLKRLRAQLVAFVCQATGGPCKYTGKDMKAAHAGMLISDEDFVALVEDLQGALDKFKVPAAEQKELLGALGPTKADIVEPQPEPVPGSESVRQATADRARALREGAALLEKAAAARHRGNRSLAEQLFSAAELIVGGDSLGELAALFREGAPPRVNTPLKTVAADSPPQPVAQGSSDEDEPEPAVAAPRRRRSSLRGEIRGPGGAPLGGFAVITLEPTSGKFARRQPKRRVIEQRQREFAPKVLAVPVGSTVSFPNFDPIYHNVFSRSPANSFDLGLYRSGLTRELAFEKEGIVRVGCNLHANMSAYVVVVSAPHYVITDQEGRFNFASVAPGRYRLQAFSERSQEPMVEAIEIKPEANQIALTLTLAGDRPARALDDKFGAPRGGNVAR